jgi:predicted RNA-binding protein Jag
VRYQDLLTELWKELQLFVNNGIQLQFVQGDTSVEATLSTSTDSWSDRRILNQLAELSITRTEAFQFPASLSARQRKLIHATVARYGLKSTSQGEGIDRCIAVTAV